MDKRVILAVAGSGKTTLIIDNLNLATKSLIVTYTNNNLNNLRLGITKKFGYFPSNLFLFSYFTFLHSFCYKPFLQLKYRTKGINYEPNYNRYSKDIARYIDRHHRLYSNRIAKLIEENELINPLKTRISKYFENFFIDEIQDFAGYDFNLIMNLVKADANILLVGDFFQHTYDTSRDGNVNSNLHKDYDSYKRRFQHEGIKVDTTTLNKSYRCSPSVCNFIETELGIPIESHRDDETRIRIIDDPELALKILNNRRIVKLFYQEHYKYACYSRNWGDSKGEDKYNSVCVILNKRTNALFKDHNLKSLSAQTLNKLYVACSRTRNTLYFIPEELIKHLKEK